MEEIRIHQFAEKLALRGYLPRTIEDYQAAVRMFMRYLSEKENVSTWEQVGAHHLVSYQTYVQFARLQKGKNLSAVTVCGRIGPLKTFYRVMHQEGLLPHDLGEVMQLPKIRKRLPRHVPSYQDIARLLEQATGDDILTIRDRAMLELLYATAIRSEEIRQLRMTDYDMDEGRLFVRGKGAKDRVVPVGAWVAPYIERYREHGRPYLVRDDTDLLFLTRRGARLGRNDLWRILNRYACSAKLAHIMPHGFRHACATHLLHNGADIRVVQELLGHASLASTQIYTKVDIKDLQRAHTRFHPRECEATDPHAHESEGQCMI